jgi:ATP-dependent protease HslVU (ClpYQ) peptidase subunit
MTTVAYSSCDGVMAADTAVSDGDVVTNHAHKLRRMRDGTLVGYCGAFSASATFMEWISRGAPPDEKPDVAGLMGLVVMPNGKIYLFESKRYGLIALRDSYCAIGSGQAVALGAMYAGAGAEKAIRAAIKHDRNTAGRVQTIRLRG